MLPSTVPWEYDSTGTNPPLRTAIGFQPVSLPRIPYKKDHRQLSPYPHTHTHIHTKLNTLQLFSIVNKGYYFSSVFYYEICL